MASVKCIPRVRSYILTGSRQSHARATGFLPLQHPAESPSEPGDPSGTGIPRGIQVHRSPLRARMYQNSLNTHVSEVIIRQKCGTGPE